MGVPRVQVLKAAPANKEGTTAGQPWAMTLRVQAVNQAVSKAAVVVVRPAAMIAAVTATAVAGGRVKNKVVAVKRAANHDEYGQQRQQCDGREGTPVHNCQVQADDMRDVLSRGLRIQHCQGRACLYKALHLYCAGEGEGGRHIARAWLK
jgi:hypothetical protein